MSQFYVSAQIFKFYHNVIYITRLNSFEYYIASINNEGYYVFFLRSSDFMIGEQLRTLRTANKMTQKELAGELSVAFQTISNWENNSIDPSVNMILRIAEYFNCSTDYLLKGDGSGAKYIDTTQLTEHQHAQLLGIAKEFSRLNQK